MTEPSVASAPSWREHLVPGFILGLLAGVLLIAVGSRGVVRGQVATGGTRTLRFDGAITILGILMILAFVVLSLSARRPGLRIGGLVVALTGAFLPALAIIRARTDERFAKNTPVELLGSGKLAVLASALALAGFALAALHPRWLGGENRAPARAILLSAAGTLLFPLAAVGIGFGMLGRESELERTRVQSLGAVIIGAVAVVGWSILLVVGVLTFNR